MAPFRQILLAFGLALSALLPLTARTLTFEAEKCRCEIPDDWTDNHTADVLVDFRGPPSASSIYRNFRLEIGPFPDSPGWIDNPIVARTLEDGLVSDGFTITGHSKGTLGGLDALVIDTTNSNIIGTVCSRTFFTCINGRFYSISLTEYNGRPESDPDLKAMLQSFIFIGTPETSPAIAPAAPGSALAPAPAFVSSPVLAPRSAMVAKAGLTRNQYLLSGICKFAMTVIILILIRKVIRSVFKW